MFCPLRAGQWQWVKSLQGMRSGSNSIGFAPSDVFWAHIVLDTVDTEQKHMLCFWCVCLVDKSSAHPGVTTQIKSPRLSECLLCVRRCSGGFSGIVTIYRWLLQLAH